MRTIVTGAAGLIGSHLFKYLLKRGHTVLGIDNYSIGTFIHKRIIKLDLVKNRQQLQQLVKKFKPEAVYHLAAWAHEGLSQFSPIRITENNYTAHLHLLNACINSGVKRYVVASSMSVYGDQNPPFNESMTKRPCDIYAIAKSAIEDSTQILSKVYGFEYCIIRPHNVYGPYQVMSDPYRNVVAIFINRMLINKPFYIYGDGNQKRAFTYIDDLTPYLAKCGTSKKVVGEIINIGPTDKVSVNELAKEIMKHFPKAPEPIYLSERPLEVKYAWSTNHKAQKLLGYKTRTSFSEGIKKMVIWAKRVGYQKPKYLKRLELEMGNTPLTWKKKLI